MAGHPGPDGHSDEQSIETVLHSIRRILKDDEAKPASHDGDGEEETFMLDASMMVTQDERPQPSNADRSLLAIAQRAEAREQADQAAALHNAPEKTAEKPSGKAAAQSPQDQAAPIPAAPAPEADVSRDARGPGNPPGSNGLMANQTLAAAERSLDALHEALSRHERRRSLTGDTPVTMGGITIEDMVRQEVRGMVQTWLDAHLPSLVEIMVRAEISKMSRN